MAWYVGLELDEDKSILSLARRQDDEGNDKGIAKFPIREEAKNWLRDSGEIDASCFDIYLIEQIDDFEMKSR